MIPSACDDYNRSSINSLCPTPHFVGADMNLATMCSWLPAKCPQAGADVMRNVLHRAWTAEDATAPASTTSYAPQRDGSPPTYGEAESFVYLGPLPRSAAGRGPTPRNDVMRAASGRPGLYSRTMIARGLKPSRADQLGVLQEVRAWLVPRRRSDGGSWIGGR